MSKPFVFEKPLGMRDLLPDLVRQQQTIMDRIRQEMEQWGYEPIQTPTLEYYDTVGDYSATMEQRLFKLLDRSGRTVVLRPDMTGPIARVVGSMLKEQPFPIRLYYEGSVYRAQQNEAGRNAEFPEIGIECIGEEAPDADAEVITLAVLCLQAAGVDAFRITVGHVGFINALFDEMIGNQDHVNRLKDALHAKNMVGYQQIVHSLDLSASVRRTLGLLPGWKGSIDRIAAALDSVPSGAARTALHHLQDLWQVLRLHGVADRVMFDVSLVRDMGYYTGMIFEGYAEELGFPICSGGRYDQLLARFGRPAPATGFALKVDRIMQVSSVTVSGNDDRVRLTYRDADRADAFAQARKLRKQGKRVVLHREGGNRA